MNNPAENKHSRTPMTNKEIRELQQKTIDRETKIVNYYLKNGEEVKINISMVKQFFSFGKEAITVDEASKFIMSCKSHNLNPWLGECILLKFRGSGGTSQAQIIVTMNAFIRRAGEHPQFNGMEDGITILTNEGVVERRAGGLVLEGDRLLGGWCKVHRKDREIPFYEEVALKEYAKSYTDSSGKETFRDTWASYTATMIKKVAKVHALRKAFPDSFGGLYELTELNKQVDDDVINKVEQNSPPPMNEAVENPIVDDSLAVSNFLSDNGIPEQWFIDKWNSDRIDKIEKISDLTKEQVLEVMDTLYKMSDDDMAIARGEEGIDKLLKDDEPLLSPLGVTNE